jgi:transposase
MRIINTIRSSGCQDFDRGVHHERRCGDLIKLIWHDGDGACLFVKRLERGRFLWPSVADGVVTISAAQLTYLLSGIDWRMPQKTWRPTAAG